MLTSTEVLNYVKAAPFRPFRIHMPSGRTHDIRHPEMIRVGKQTVIVFTFVSDQPEVFDDWQGLSLHLAESISYLDAPVAT